MPHTKYWTTDKTNGIIRDYPKKDIQNKRMDHFQYIFFRRVGLDVRLDAGYSSALGCFFSRVHRTGEREKNSVATLTGYLLFDFQSMDLPFSFESFHYFLHFLQRNTIYRWVNVFSAAIIFRLTLFTRARHTPNSFSVINFGSFCVRFYCCAARVCVCVCVSVGKTIVRSAVSVRAFDASICTEIHALREPITFASVFAAEP